MKTVSRILAGAALALLVALFADAATRTVVIDSGGTARVLKNDRVFVVDSGGTTRKVTRLFVIDSGGTSRLVYQNVVWGLAGGSISDTPTSTTIGTPATDSVSVRVQTDGNVSVVAQNDGTYVWEQWTNVPDTSKWVRWTNTSGAINVGTAGTWQQLNANRTFGFSYTGLTGAPSVTGTLQIAADSGGAVILASASYTLTPQVLEF